MPRLDQGTRVRHLRARLRPGYHDPLALQRRFERLFVAQDLPSSLLPPDAILCVRHLTDPLPHALDPDSPDLRPPESWNRAWRSRLEGLLAVAANPLLDPAAHRAPAVLFANEAQFLACLALAASRQRLVSDWWWPALLRRDESDRWFLRWHRRPAAVPHAIACLADLDQLDALTRTIPEPVARQLTDEVAASYGFGPVSGVIDPPRVDPHPPPESSGFPVSIPPDQAISSTPGHAPDSDRLPGGRPGPSLHDRATPHPPDWQNSASNDTPASPSTPPSAWTTVLPDLDDCVAPRPVRALLATALLLVRDPPQVRTPDFPARLRRWLEAPPTSDLASAPGAPHSNPPKPIALPPPPSAEPTARTSSRPLPKIPSSPALPVRPPPSAVDRRAAIRTEPPGKAPGDSTAATPPNPTTQTEALTPGAADPTATDRFPTQLGGAFYLLNIALALGLYGDFTQPRRPGLSLSPWDFLALLLGRLLPLRFAEDPLRSRLATWAGRRPDDPPGAGFIPPAEWRLPSEWLLPFVPPTGLRWVESRGRLLARHEAGFVVVDVLRIPMPRAHQIAIEGANYPHPLAEPAPSTPPDSADHPQHLAASPSPSSSPSPNRPPDLSPGSDESRAIASWLDRLLPYLEARATLALQRKPPALAALVTEPARIETRGDRVWVHFALDLHPLDTRLAGLDRDPGRIPAAGRNLTFHYD